MVECKAGYKEREGKCERSKGFFDKKVFRKNKWLKKFLIISSIVIGVAVIIFLIYKFGGFGQILSVSSPGGPSTGLGGGGGHS